MTRAVGASIPSGFGLNEHIGAGDVIEGAGDRGAELEVLALVVAYGT
jgi:hypothetical protein